MPPENTGNSSTAKESQPARQPNEGEIDLKALAQKIYKLLREEARLERERLGRSRIK
jgi:hypothetical protein